MQSEHAGATAAQLMGRVLTQAAPRDRDHRRVRRALPHARAAGPLMVIMHGSAESHVARQRLALFVLIISLIAALFVLFPVKTDEGPVCHAPDALVEQYGMTPGELAVCGAQARRELARAGGSPEAWRTLGEPGTRSTLLQHPSEHE